MAGPTAAAREGAPPSDAEVVAAARSLGGLARGSVALWRELSDPQVEAQRVARVLHADPGIAARVVKVANSAFYGRGRQVASIDRAIVVLGLDAVRGIAAAAGLDRVVPRGVAGAAFAAHCAVVAALARALSRRMPALQPAEAFLAGLLHDFGLLVEWRLLAARPSIPVPPGSLHARWGALVLASWQLPAPIVATVANHHHAGGRALCACVRAAHAGAVALGHALAAEGGADEAPDRADLAALGLDAASWAAWLADAGDAARAEGLAIAK